MVARLLRLGAQYSRLYDIPQELAKRERELGIALLIKSCIRAVLCHGVEALESNVK